MDFADVRVYNNVKNIWVRVRVRVIQMVFLLLCMAEPDKTTEKSTGKQPHGRER